MSPTQVEIVRPYRKPSELVSALVGHWAEYAVTAWLVMLLVPSFTAWHPGYWPTLAAVFVARMLQQPPTSHTYWSRAGKKPNDKPRT